MHRFGWLLCSVLGHRIQEQEKGERSIHPPAVTSHGHKTSWHSTYSAAVSQVGDSKQQAKRTPERSRQNTMRSNQKGTMTQPSLLLWFLDQRFGFTRVWNLSRKLGFSKNENRKSQKTCSMEKNWQAIKMMDLWMQTEGIKLIFTMNFSVLDSSNLPPECLKVHRF